MSSNAFASPDTPAPEPSPPHIESLAVSETWKRRFRAIEAGQAPGLNLLAFLFGPLYYLAKGMWRQALTFLAINAAVVLAADVCHSLVASGNTHLQPGYVYLLSGVVYAIKANKDYYRKVVLRTHRWL